VVAFSKSFGSHAKSLVSREATTLRYWHIFLCSQGRLLDRKTLKLRYPWEFGSVPHDTMRICRRNRRLLLLVQLCVTWPDRNLPKKQTTTAGSPNTQPAAQLHRSCTRKGTCHRLYQWSSNPADGVKGLIAETSDLKRTKGQGQCLFNDIFWNKKHSRVKQSALEYENRQ
jgi:hypothetical protein